MESDYRELEEEEMGKLVFTGYRAVVFLFLSFAVTRIGPLSKSAEPQP